MKRSALNQTLTDLGSPAKWHGSCHHCRVGVDVTAKQVGNDIIVDGGAVFEADSGKLYLKCDRCYVKKPTLVRGVGTEVRTGTIKGAKPKPVAKPKAKAKKKTTTKKKKK